MKFIFRRAKDTRHFMLFETKAGKVGYLMHFPEFLWVVALATIIGFDRTGEWWKPWSIVAMCLIVLYLIFRLRTPWEGERLPLIQAERLY